MISIPTIYYEGEDQVTHRYYGNFILELTKLNMLDGLYGLNGKMVDEALGKFGAHLGDNEIIFEDAKKSTMFLLRYS